MWLYGYSLCQFVDTPMHQLFQGDTRTLINTLNEYFAFFMKKSTFATGVNQLLLSIRDLKLKWCKIETLHTDSYTTGGWIVESYLAYAIFIPVIYARILHRRHTQLEIETLTYMAVLVHSSHTMISYLMSLTDTDTDEVEDYVKLFLSACNVFCAFHGTSSSKSIFGPVKWILFHCSTSPNRFGCMGHYGCIGGEPVSDLSKESNPFNPQ